MVVEKLNKRYSVGFTVVELLVVIIVIGILASIVIVSYTGLSKKAIESSIASDLASNSTLLKLYQVENDAFPSSLDGSNCPSAPKPDTKYCLKASPTTTLNYSGNGQVYVLKATSKGLTYQINEAGSIVASLSCPTNFIIVPGSATYGTSDFCVMKYEAKNNGSNIAVSKPDGTPWVQVSHDTAINYAQTVANCASCHLISEREWMTIAQNVLSVPSNWRDNVVGTGSSNTNYIYYGHSDSIPNTVLAADSDDSLGYINTGNFSGDGSGNYGIYGDTQRRTLRLTNGEVIWDFAGNVWELTAGQITGVQPGKSTDSSWASNQWKTINTNMGVINPSPFPVGTGIATAADWDTWNGIGELRSNINNTDTREFIRGGAYNSNQGTGVLALDITLLPDFWFDALGFRVAGN